MITTCWCLFIYLYLLILTYSLSTCASEQGKVIGLVYLYITIILAVLQIILLSVLKWTVYCTLRPRSKNFDFHSSSSLLCQAPLVYWSSALPSPCLCIYLLASERSERDTLRSVQSRIVIYYYYIYIMVRANFVLITRKEGGV